MFYVVAVKGAYSELEIMTVQTGEPEMALSIAKTHTKTEGTVGVNAKIVNESHTVQSLFHFMSVGKPKEEGGDHEV